jgi:hypothetical protein
MEGFFEEATRYVKFDTRIRDFGNSIQVEMIPVLTLTHLNKIWK